MCFTVSIFASTHEIETDLGATFDDPGSYQPYFHVSAFTHPVLPVVTNERADAIELVQWGLIPRWVKDVQAANDLRDMTLNARSETIFQKPSFRDAIAKRRALLPVNGFVEWRTEGKVKLPHYVHMRDRSLFTMGCIWEDWTDTASGEHRRTFSIVTTEANGLLSWVHNAKQRMPLIITTADRQRWLEDADRESLTRLMRPLEGGVLEAVPLSRDMSRIKVNTDHKELLQGIADAIVDRPDDMDPE